MAFSYSFHISSKSHAVSTTKKVAQVSRHNLREYKKSSHYDPTLIQILQGSESSILDSVKQIYHNEFDAALEIYNSGKRPDRQIQDYLKHVSDSRSDVACEIIIQLGDKDFWETKSLEERKQMVYIFRDQLRYLDKLVPEFKVASAVIHYDESSPHMHIVGVPVATGYKKGLEKQVAKTKVFTQSKLSFLQDRMRERAERGMQLPQNSNLFDGIEIKSKEIGRNKDIPKYAMDAYAAITESIEAGKKEKTALAEELAKVSDEIQEADQQLCQKQSEITDAKANLDQIYNDTTAAQEELSEAQNTLSQFHSEAETAKDAMESSLDEKRQELDCMKEEKEILTGQISVAERELAQIHSDTVAAKDELIKLTADVDAGKKEESSLADQLSKSSDALQDAEQQLAHTQSEISEAQQTLDQIQRDTAEAHRRLDDACDAADILVTIDQAADKITTDFDQAVRTLPNPRKSLLGVTMSEADWKSIPSSINALKLAITAIVSGLIHDLRSQIVDYRSRLEKQQEISTKLQKELDAEKMSNDKYPTITAPRQMWSIRESVMEPGHQMYLLHLPDGLKIDGQSLDKCIVKAMVGMISPDRHSCIAKFDPDTVDGIDVSGNTFQIATEDLLPQIQDVLDHEQKPKQSVLDRLAEKQQQIDHSMDHRQRRQDDLEL